MKRIDKFVDDTSLLWFLGLVMTVGFMYWLIIWALYEIVMSIFLQEDEEIAAEKKAKKAEKKRAKDEAKEKEVAEKIAEEIVKQNEEAKQNSKTYI